MGWMRHAGTKVGICIQKLILKAGRSFVLNGNEKVNEKAIKRNVIILDILENILIVRLRRNKNAKKNRSQIAH